RLEYQDQYGLSKWLPVPMIIESQNDLGWKGSLKLIQSNPPAMIWDIFNLTRCDVFNTSSSILDGPSQWMGSVYQD
ncbi:hypothetical protein HGM15179_018829, partial [Zosterops borbonicus]